jgi:hypothetical protein
MNGGMRTIRTTTDATGHFSLDDVSSSVVFFRREGFRPATIVYAARQSFLEVQLQPDTYVADVPECSSVGRSGKQFGDSFLFLMPRGARVKRHFGEDSWDVVVESPGDHKNKNKLLIWSGFVGSGFRGDFVDDEWILEASSFSERTMRFGEDLAMDVRGKSRDGTNWRRFSHQIIDSVCHRKYGQAEQPHGD